MRMIGMINTTIITIISIVTSLPSTIIIIIITMVDTGPCFPEDAYDIPPRHIVVVHIGIIIHRLFGALFKHVLS